MIDDLKYLPCYRMSGVGSDIAEHNSDDDDPYVNLNYCMQQLYERVDKGIHDAISKM